jgi:hypothetical protein
LTALESSLVVGANKSVGIGVYTPQAGLHMLRPAEIGTAEILTRFEVGDDPFGRLTISNASATDELFIPKLSGRASGQNAGMIHEAIISADLGSNPALAYNAARSSGGALVTRPLVVYRNNGVAKVTIAADGDITATSFSPSSSREIKHDIVELDSQKAGAALRKLTPVEFVYNEDESAERRVGFIAEDVPDLVANADRRSVPIMDVVALLTKVVKDQQQTIDNQQRFNDRLARENGLLSRRQEQLLRRLEVLENRDRRD